MNDDQLFLANAYHDGELTADERRIAESDPVVMAEVEQLRALQNSMRDLPAPSPAARESAIDAAMAEFVRRPETVPPETSPIPLRPRPAYAKVLSIAAAVVAVAGLGIIVSQADLGRGDDDAATTDVAESASAEPVADQGTAALGTLENAADDAVAEAAADGGADESMVSDSEEEAIEMVDGDEDSGLTEDAGAAAEEADMSEAAAAPRSTQPRIVGPAFDPAEPIIDPVDLGIYGVYLIGERDAGRLPPSPNTRCSVDDEILDTASIVLDEARMPVYISLVEAEGLVFARDTVSCAVVMVGSIFVE